MKTRRSGRLSVRLTPDFLDACAQAAADRDQTLTEFVQIAMAVNLARPPLKLTREAEKWMKQ
jgi:uncharacterized protein (DUF1778 family)